MSNTNGIIDWYYNKSQFGSWWNRSHYNDDGDISHIDLENVSPRRITFDFGQHFVNICQNPFDLLKKKFHDKTALGK